MTNVAREIEVLRVAMKGYAKDAREFGFCPKAELARMRKELHVLNAKK